ncbi:unnamed protein product, partial [Didymodactylos carnosus]
YGFRFILQADFEIPSSRQDICQNNLWNDWLIQKQMIHLLPKAYEKFQRLPELLQDTPLSKFNSIQTLKYFLKLIPKKGEYDIYFHRMMEQSIEILMGIIKFPVKKDDSIDWMPPSKCVYIKDQFIRKILTQEMLSKYFDRYYLHDQLMDIEESKLLKFGVTKLTFGEIIKFIQILCKEQEHTTKKSLEQICQWLLCL